MLKTLLAIIKTIVILNLSCLLYSIKVCMRSLLQTECQLFHLKSFKFLANFYVLNLETLAPVAALL